MNTDQVVAMNNTTIGTCRRCGGTLHILGSEIAEQELQDDTLVATIPFL